mgnify:CR=1 FL=1
MFSESCTLSSYEELVSGFLKEEKPVKKVWIPKMYAALIDSGMKAAEAKDKIQSDERLKMPPNTARRYVPATREGSQRSGLFLKNNSTIQVTDGSGKKKPMSTSSKSKDQKSSERLSSTITTISTEEQIIPKSIKHHEPETSVGTVPFKIEENLISEREAALEKEIEEARKTIELLTAASESHKTAAANDHKKINELETKIAGLLQEMTTMNAEFQTSRENSEPYDVQLPIYIEFKCANCEEVRSVNYTVSASCNPEDKVAEIKGMTSTKKQLIKKGLGVQK